jgi:hypothetical protein
MGHSSVRTLQRYVSKTATAHGNPGIAKGVGDKIESEFATEFATEKRGGGKKHGGGVASRWEINVGWHAKP